MQSPVNCQKLGDQYKYNKINQKNKIFSKNLKKNCGADKGGWTQPARAVNARLRKPLPPNK
jgi:23S rRNA U2552 (ribose-2'-O)-methylase RlmE/FtsJ